MYKDYDDPQSVINHVKFVQNDFGRKKGKKSKMIKEKKNEKSR